MKHGGRVWSPSRPAHPPRKRKQGCYNLFSWLSMKVRGRATRASVRLDLLPLTPTVYLLSAASPSPLLLSAYLPPPALIIQDLPTVTLHPHSCACSFLRAYHFSHLLLLLCRFFFPSLFCVCIFSRVAAGCGEHQLSVFVPCEQKSPRLLDGLPVNE